MSGPRLSIIPAGAIFDRTLEGRDLQVLGLLGCHTDKAGWCRRSQVKMARQINCGRSSVQRSLDRLVEAGWVEKKRPPGGNDEGQPSASYMYRVILDRDDLAILSSEEADPDDAESHAEIASEEGECPPVGTGGAQQDGHPGAQPYVGTGAHTHVGTKNVPLERPPIERERDARAKDRKARFLTAFEARWPTAAGDDRQRTAYAAGELTEEEEAVALAGIAPFLENQKHIGRKYCPAGWNYLEQRRWTLLEAQKAARPQTTGAFPRDSVETKALRVMFDIAGCSDAFHRIILRGDTAYYRGEITPKLLKLADAPRREEWVALDRQQAAAWEGMLSDGVGVPTRSRLHEGSLAPWLWPPRKDGELSPTGPPDSLMTEQDLRDFQ